MEGQVTLTYRDLVAALRELGLDRSTPVIAHTSLTTFEHIHGGAEAVLGALLATCDTLIMPTFTYKTMVIPEVGPPNNGLEYRKGFTTNRLAEIFHPQMPADPIMGILPESLRRHPQAERSLHPILSFAGINAGEALNAQTYAEPLAPIQVLAESQGWVLLLGVSHTANTSIHYAERLAGRNQFVRWALTARGVRECPRFPGCSAGFDIIATRFEGSVRFTQLGTARLQAIPLPALIETVREWIANDPVALLCERDNCGRCSAVREQAYLTPGV